MINTMNGRDKKYQWCGCGVNLLLTTLPLRLLIFFKSLNDKRMGFLD
jgi:hypothetical protein